MIDIKSAGNHREDRFVATIAREAAAFIASEAGNESLITVTRAESSAHGERISVYVSVFPNEKARSALTFLERRRETFSDHLKAHTRFRALPRITFLLENKEL